MARYRGRIRYRIDWDDSSVYSHAKADVTDDVISFAARHGSNTSSNQRPLMQSMRGSIQLYGRDYIPGESTTISISQLQGKHLFYAQWQGTSGTAWVTLASGWVSGLRADAGATAPVATMQVEGFRYEGLAERKVFTQDRSSANANDSGTETELETLFGVTALSSASNIPSTPLGIFSVNQSVGQTASQFALVSGTLPIERADGTPAFVDPVRSSPTLKATINSASWAISGLRSRSATEHIVNYALVDYHGEGSQQTVERSGTFVIESSTCKTASTQTADQTYTVDLPAFTTDNYGSSVTVNSTSIGARFLHKNSYVTGQPTNSLWSRRKSTGGFSTYFKCATVPKNGSTVRLDAFGRSTSVATGNESATRLASIESDFSARITNVLGGANSLEFTLPIEMFQSYSDGGVTHAFEPDIDMENDGTYSRWGYIRDATYFNSATGSGNVRSNATYDPGDLYVSTCRYWTSRLDTRFGASVHSSTDLSEGDTWTAAYAADSGRDLLYGLYVDYDISYQVSYAADPVSVTVQNADSITRWGRREVDFPVWFVRNSTSNVQARIDNLAAARNEHQITLPLDQPTEALSRSVAQLDAGDYVGLHITDPGAHLSIGETALITSVEYRDAQTQPAAKVITVIETGEALTADPLYLDSTADPLYQDSTADPLLVR